MILDAATLYAYFVTGSDGHWSASGRVELAEGVEQLVVSPFVIAELEVLVRPVHGDTGWLACLDQLASRAWTIPPFDVGHLRELRPHVERGATLAEASLAVLAERDDS